LSQIDFYSYLSGVRGNRQTHTKLTSWRALTAGGVELMGAWGYGIEDNDRYLDIYGELMDEFNRCVPIGVSIINSMDRWLYGGMRISDSHNF